MNFVAMDGVVGFIFARGGSKGLPRKNILHLGGKPLIGWAIQAARQSELIERVIVSTDDAEIAAVARDFGAETPFMRPPALAADDSPEMLAWQHAIRFLLDEGSALRVFVSIPATAPLRLSSDVDGCITALLDDPAKDVVVTVTPAARNPHYDMVSRASDGSIRVLMAGDDHVQRRQAAPPVFDVTPVAYAARPEFVLSTDYLFSGTVGSIVIPRERAVDIDTMTDFRLAEVLLHERDER